MTNEYSQEQRSAARRAHSVDDPATFALPSDALGTASQASRLPQSHWSPLAKILASEGKGRTVCLLREAGRDEEMSRRLFEQLALRARAVLIELPVLDDLNWQLSAEAVRSAVSEAGVRQASFIGYGPAASVVLNLYLQDPRLIRTIAILDAACRPHPSRVSRVVDWVESHLPLGLPLRLRTAGFDAKPFLHRIRCPVLVLTSPGASLFERSQAEEMSRRIPTAWHVPIADLRTSQLNDLLLWFYDVPARCPQKNLPRAGAR